jgi:hypothetical protein
MHRKLPIFVLLVVAGLSSAGIAGSLTDGQIRQPVIGDSIATYPGHCP